MTDPVTRARAAVIRMLEAEKERTEKERSVSPLSFVNICTKEIQQEIEQAVLVERKRCAGLVRSYNPYRVLMSLEETKRMIEDMALDIEEGVDCDVANPTL